MRPDAHALVPLYAADTLDGQDVADVRAHLAQCPTCREDLVVARETLAVVAEAIVDDPPPRLRSAVLNAIATTRQERVPAAAAPGRKRARSGSVLALAASLAAVLVLSAGGLGVLADRLGDSRREQRAIAQVLTSGEVRVVRAADDGTAGGTAVVLAADGSALLVPGRLDPAPDGYTYQAWYLAGGQARSAGTFAVKADDPAVVQLPAVDGADAVAVSLEPAGGSPAPTTDPVAVLPLA